MADTNTEMKLSLKIMVDIKAKKVVFAEADKDFVNFLFNLMSLPLLSVTKVLLLNEKGMVGSLGALYKSIESLGSQYFQSSTQNASVLKPRSFVNIPLLSLQDWPASNSFYRCSTANHNTISDVPGSVCTCGYTMGGMMNYTFIAPKKTVPSPGYVKETVVYMVMDNLEVKPMSIALIKTLVKDFDVLEEKQVEIGLQEGLALLKASLVTSTVLTSVFLEKN